MHRDLMFALRTLGHSRGFAAAAMRLAVGATRPHIVRLLLGRGVTLAVIGLAIGAPLAVGGARLLEGLLFRVSAWDPMFWLAVPAALLGPILLANYPPGAPGEPCGSGRGAAAGVSRRPSGT